MVSAVTEKAGYTNISHAPTSSKLPQAQAPKGIRCNPKSGIYKHTTRSDEFQTTTGTGSKRHPL